MKSLRPVKGGKKYKLQKKKRFTSRVQEGAQGDPDQMNLLIWLLSTWRSSSSSTPSSLWMSELLTLSESRPPEEDTHSSGTNCHQTSSGPAQDYQDVLDLIPKVQ